jgi:tRNA (guanine37-N1)-methyltransferase
MRFHIITIFPEMFDSYLNESIIRRARDAKKIDVKIYQLRSFTSDTWKKVDDRPYAGGPGMVMMAEPILKAVEKIKIAITKKKNTKIKTIIFSPGGKEFSNTYARTAVKKYTDLILISGRYEGIDARAQQILKAEELSVGPYVLTGGELPAMVVIDAIARHIPGVLGNKFSPEESRISSHKTYTRPEILSWKGKKYRVPKILLSGDHKKIDAWRVKKGGFDNTGQKN